MMDRQKFKSTLTTDLMVPRTVKDRDDHTVVEGEEGNGPVDSTSQNHDKKHSQQKQNASSKLHSLIMYRILRYAH